MSNYLIRSKNCELFWRKTRPVNDLSNGRIFIVIMNGITQADILRKNTTGETVKTTTKYGAGTSYTPLIEGSYIFTEEEANVAISYYKNHNHLDLIKIEV